jgi:tetratricopeptide (TPR) repeat protein
MLEMDENYFPAYDKIAEVYIQKLMFDEAIEALQKSIAISNGAATVKGKLGFAYACAGRDDEARKILRELEEDSKKRYVSPIAIAIVHCGLGEKDQAIKWLEKSCEERAGGVTTIKVRPMWASLRSEPRFIKLLDKMGLNA